MKFPVASPRQTPSARSLNWNLKNKLKMKGASVKTQAIPTTNSEQRIFEKNDLRLLAAGGSVKKVISKNLKDRLVSTGQWLKKNWDRGDHIHRQLQARKNEDVLRHLKNGLPPRF